MGTVGAECGVDIRLSLASTMPRRADQARGQHSAAMVVKHALAIGAAVVLIETLPPSVNSTLHVPEPPWAQLRGAIEWVCKKSGLELREVPAEYILMLCPACERLFADNVSGAGKPEKTPGLARVRTLSVSRVASTGALTIAGRHAGA